LARFVKGDVVVVPFPFSDLTHAKRRPALVVAELEGDDLILCQITSQRIKDRFAVSIDVKVILKQEYSGKGAMCDQIAYLQQTVTLSYIVLVSSNLTRLVR